MKVPGQFAARERLDLGQALLHEILAKVLDPALAALSIAALL
jgi:hypothetical protein